MNQGQIVHPLLKQFQGWKIVLYVLVFLALIFTSVWGIQGVTEQGTLFLVRITARTSFICFGLAFVAASLYRLWPSPTSLWILRNRRFLGLSMAVSHTYHAIAFLTLEIGLRGKLIPGVFPTLPFGYIGYLFLMSMTVTSFPKPAKAIGQRAWQLLHTAGMYIFALTFLEEFVGRLVFSIQPSFILAGDVGSNRDILSYSALSILIIGAITIRIVGRKRNAAEPLTNLDL